MGESNNCNAVDEEFQLPPRHIASLNEVSEDHRVLYVRETNGYRLRPQVAADFDRWERDYRLGQVEHEREMLRIENQILTERCLRLERKANSAAGHRIARVRPADLENSFSAQLAQLKSGLVR